MSDMVDMLRAVQRGGPEAFKRWIGALDEMEAIEQLTKTYGGRPHQHGEDRHFADAYGLFQRTSSILHAAKTGNASMFSAVLHEMRQREVNSPHSMTRDFLAHGGGGTDICFRSEFISS